MKRLFFTILGCCLSMSVWAQGKLLPLPYNPVYPQQQQSLQKDVQQDFSNFCEGTVGQLSIRVQEEVLPPCKGDTGSFTIIVDNPFGTGDLTYRVQGIRTMRGRPLIDQTTVTSDTQLTIFGAQAAAYFIEVIDAVGRTNTLTFIFNNLDTETINFSESFLVTPAFCDSIGQLTRGFVVQVGIFSVLDMGGNTVATFNNTDQQTGTVDLPVGQYVLEGLTARQCNNYFTFTVPQLPVIHLPFIEDFSGTTVNPNPQSWADRQAFVNQTLGRDPITLGVATLDGLNEFGRPYQAVPSFGQEQLIDGPADTLTSRPVCFQQAQEGGLSEADSVYLSFFYQAEGFGDYPNEQDSLLLEFRAANGTWVGVDLTPDDPIGKGIPGPDNANPNVQFTPVIIKIVDSLLYDGFQFRFRNYATVSGFNDHWHIDYVVLDANRTATDSTFVEVGFVDPAPSLFNEYTLVPWTHLKNNLNTVFVESDEVEFTVRNLSNNVTNVSMNYSLIDVCGNALIHGINDVTLPTSQTGFGWQQFPANTTATANSNQLFQKSDLVMGIQDLLETPAFQADSILLASQWHLASGLSGQRTNDTIIEYLELFNSYAYDDGTAEKTFSLFGSDSKWAYEFELLQSDTLRGVQIAFVPHNINVTESEFKLAVWDSIDTENFSNYEELIFANDTSNLPSYMDERNGFWTYHFEEPLAVSGKIYIGFIQEGEEFLNVGFDCNNDVSNRLFYNTTSEWFQSLFEGALMIRPLFGQSFKPIVGISEQTQQAHKTLKVFPNPTHDYLYIDAAIAPHQQIRRAQVFDYSGKLVLDTPMQHNGLEVRTLGAGMYLVKVFDQEFNEVGVGKFVKY